MHDEIVGHLFLSYSHTDEPFMLAFRKHLKGMLLNKMEVWSDTEISKGSEWESFLRGNLNQASSAVILATPDYLVSPWCRRELKELAAAHRAGRLRNLFWVELKPCGWKHTELAAFQSLETSNGLAIAELPDEMQRQRAILRACEQIAPQILSSITAEDNHIAFVRRLLLDAPADCDITVTNVVDATGAFSIVCQGRNGSINAAIKVLRRSPLQRVTRDFLRIGEKRKELRDPSFVRIHDIFEVGGEEERRIIIVSDFVSDGTMLSDVLKRREPLTIDKTALLLRRMAEGLASLHKAGSQDETSGKDPDKEWEWTLGLLRPEDIYYDQPAERLRVAPIGISSFLWHVLDCATYENWVNPNAKFYVSPEQRHRPGKHLTFKTDQYMLGRLGVELLEGMEFDRILERRSGTVEDFWDGPANFIANPWKNNHRQLWEILERLLKKSPEERFESMEDVVHELRGLEEQDRALAKCAYCPPTDENSHHTLELKGNSEFFKDFYETFFRASPESRKKFENIAPEDQYENLMKSMAAVLNFRKGNEPTSLDAILKKHSDRGITEDEFRTFHKAFLDTIAKFTNGDQEVVKAWDGLLKPVVDYMILKCTRHSSTSEEPVYKDGSGSSSSSAQPGLQDQTHQEQTHMEAR